MMIFGSSAGPSAARSRTAQLGSSGGNHGYKRVGAELWLVPVYIAHVCQVLS